MKYFLNNELFFIWRGNTILISSYKGFAGLAAACPCLFCAGIWATAVYQELHTLCRDYYAASELPDVNWLHTSELTNLSKVHLVSTIVKLLGWHQWLFPSNLLKVHTRRGNAYCKYSLSKELFLEGIQTWETGFRISMQRDWLIFWHWRALNSSMN